MATSIEANGRSTSLSKSTLASVKYTSRMVADTTGSPRTKSSTKKGDTTIQMAPYTRDIGMMENARAPEPFVTERETNMRANGKQINMTSTAKSP